MNNGIFLQAISFQITWFQLTFDVFDYGLIEQRGPYLSSYRPGSYKTRVPALSIGHIGKIVAVDTLIKIFLDEVTLALV